jgi:PDZ domain-containing secreted protein
MGAFVTTVAVNLPLLLDQDRTINATSLFNGTIRLGNRIMNVGGNDIANGTELANEMKKRVEGEQITLTVENLEGNKKVVYVTLGRIPLG